MAREHPLILQLDVAGNPQRWMTYEDAAYYKAKDLIAWTAGGSDFTIYGGTSRLTGDRSSMELNTIIAIKGVVGSGGSFRTPTLTNKALFRRDKNLCAYCGCEFGDVVLTRDHIHPRSRRGLDVWKNVVTACGPCNKYKNDRTPEEANMKLLYVPYVPTRSEYLLLMNRTVLADQMDFLKARIPLYSRIHATV